MSKRKVPHPSGISMSMIPPLTDYSSPLVFAEQTLHNSRVAMFNSVKPSSRGTYMTGWHHWLQWSKHFGTNPTMSTIPLHFDEIKECEFSFKEYCVLSFISHISVNQNLKPGTVSGYLAGVRFMLENMSVKTSFMDDSKAIKRTKAGLHILHRATIGQAEESRLPFTTDMVAYASDVLYNYSDTTSLAIKTAMQLGLSTVSRYSAYIRTSEDHFFRSQDIVFIIEPGCSSQASLRVTSEFIHNYSFCKVTGISVYARSAKNDPDGVGCAIPFDKSDMRSDQSFNLIRSCYDWAAHARPKYNAPFFSTSDGWKLTYKVMNKAIKDTAIHFGFNPEKFSTHSLRIGGASILAAAGVPDSLIQLLGRWRSLTFLQYIRLTTTQYKRASRAFTNTNGFNSKDLKRTNPGAILSLV
jgi:hypothetical protein